MTGSEPTAEEREKELTARLKAMEQQLERLTTHLGEKETANAPATERVEPRPRVSAPPIENAYPPDDIAGVSEELLNWANRTSLLPRLATICFLLVFALVLRTITDSGIVNKLAGSGMGMGYAAILMVAGWYMYSRQSPLAPVFATWGAILMSTIVVETHVHFDTLPLIPAYLTLVATGIFMAFISYRFNAFVPISVGTLGMCFAGAAIDYPNPFFPYLCLVLISANILAWLAARMNRCGWLRWSVLLVSVFMLQLWGVRLGNVLKRGELPPPELASAWFLPLVAVFASIYFTFSICGIIFRKTERISRFDAALPTINSLWAFSMALYVVSAGGGDVRLLGAVGAVIAVTFLAISHWLAQRAEEGASGTGAFTFACGVLLALALPAATGKLIFSLPIISVVAVFVAVVLRSWGSGTVRIATYLFQFYSCAALAFALRGIAPATDPVDILATILPAGLLTFFVLYHYQWCRWWPPSEGSSFFGRFDRNDRSAVFLLLTGLISGFFMMRCAIYHALQMVYGQLPPDAFTCSQSVLINTAAVFLIVLAYLRRDTEIRNVAILVTVVGGIKVFAFDLFSTHGLPLVFSVFSFGQAALVESIALGKWQKHTAEKTAQN
jgi:hypothetical protein